MRTALRFSLILCLGIAFAPWMQASVSIVEVQVEGVGSSLHEATNLALVEAVSRINGKAIRAEKLTASLQISSTDGDEEAFLASDGYLSLVREATNGAVEGYDVLAKRRDGMLWHVTVSARIAKYEQSDAASRKRIAIAPIRSNARSVSLADENLSPEELSRLLTQSLSDYLVDSRKFAILDRQFSEEVAGELSLIASGETASADAARLSQKLSADFLLVGTVEKFEFHLVDRRSRTSDRIFRTGRGDASMAYRLIEAATQQTVVSETVSFAVSQDRTPEDSPPASRTLIEGLARKISEDILQRIFPTMVVSADRSKVVLGQGGDLFTVGHQYNVYRLGERVVDPYTNEFLGHEEHYCCVVEITAVLPKQAYASVVRGRSELIDSFAPRRFVLRDRVVSEQKDISAEKLETLRSGIQSRRAASDSDW